MSFTELLQPIHQFLQCKTPDSWITEAQKPQRLAVLLQDHLVCELKDNVCSCDLTTNL
jgi:tRNA-(ms[2]io[6]A)-hydroxylase